MSWLMLSVSNYSLKCVCAFTHLQDCPGQTLRVASRYFSPSGEIYDSSLALQEGRLGIVMSTCIQRLGLYLGDLLAKFPHF